MYRTEPKYRSEKEKVKNGYAQKYVYTVRGICGVSPGEEKGGCSGRICRKGKSWCWLAQVFLGTRPLNACSSTVAVTRKLYRCKM